ncbi:hypothetical protein AX15_004874 [Amanita polypyramis BW_CC]|nr:hypothetical protein AX15_004874 [Amanita polypyramis BW_CC]
MLPIDNDAFLKQLTELLNKTKSSIWLTHKRLLHDGQDTAMEHQDGTEDTREYSCLMRVTAGKSVKFSTKVAPGDLDKFYSTYGSLLKSSMSTTLRKRDKKREKSRAEQAARRKKRMTEPVVVEGPKRGKGRRKRQRLVKAALKQQESQRMFKEREEKRQEAGLVPVALS